MLKAILLYEGLYRVSWDYLFADGIGGNSQRNQSLLPVVRL